MMYDLANLKKMKSLKELAPEAMAAFEAFDAAAFKDGAIPKKYKELIAVAVAFTTQCPYCIEVHVKNAKAAGRHRGRDRRGHDGGRGAAGRRRDHPRHPRDRLNR